MFLWFESVHYFYNIKNVRLSSAIRKPKSFVLAIPLTPLSSLEIILSYCRADQRNSYVQRDKLIFTPEDPYPLRMSDARRYLEVPTLEDFIIVTVNVTDGLEMLDR